MQRTRYVKVDVTDDLVQHAGDEAIAFQWDGLVCGVTQEAAALWERGMHLLWPSVRPYGPHRITEARWEMGFLFEVAT
jgi:orotidine-5'-phosphate decarboxylase